MDIGQLIKRAKEVRQKYAELELKKYGKNWDINHSAAGFVGDVGDLMKLITAKQGLRDTEDVDEKLADELSECLYFIFIIADRLGIDIGKSFLNKMDKIEKKIENL